MKLGSCRRLWLATCLLTTLGLSLGTSACASFKKAAARDPMKCERDPNCARRADRSQDCATQCADNPACIDRCASVTGQR